MKHFNRTTVKLFNLFLDRLEKGYTENYQIILHRIAFSENNASIKKYNKIYEYFLTHCKL